MLLHPGVKLLAIGIAQLVLNSQLVVQLLELDTANGMNLELQPILVLPLALLLLLLIHAT
jgi:hypothetical protein